MLRFRRATPDDRAFLTQLHHRAYREVVERQFGVWDEAAQDRWVAEGLLAADFSVIELAGVAIGAVGIQEKSDGFFLAELQISPEHQGQGWGTAALRAVLERAGVAHKPVSLRVLLHNRARELYERHGFVITGQTETHYLMEWRSGDTLDLTQG
jgi:ribosomal protein S18 acetylase RimI-like enzyme